MVSDSIEIEKLIEYAREKDMTILSYSENIVNEVLENGVKAKVIKFSPEFALLKFLKGELQSRTLEPVYLRLSQAELQRKEKNTSGKAKCDN